MSENNVNGITGADVATTTGIIGATVGIGQYIINDYVITLTPIEGDYGYTMTITRGSETQTVTLYGLSTEQYDAMLSYLEQAQAASTAAQSAADAAARSEHYAGNHATRAIGASQAATASASTAESAATHAETAATSAGNAQTAAETAASNAATAQAAAASAATDAGNAQTAAEAAATRAEDAERNAAAGATNAQTYAGQAQQNATNAGQSAASAAQTLSQVQTEGAAQIAAVDAEGQRVLASIPADYSQMEADVTDLKSQISAVDSMALGAYPIDTVSGAVAFFSDGANNIPVKDLVISIEPVQSGIGDPSPDNVRPISGWTGANINANGATIPIAFPSEAGTVYGGTLDVVTGVLTVDRNVVQIPTSYWSYNSTHNLFLSRKTNNPILKDIAHPIVGGYDVICSAYKHFNGTRYVDIADGEFSVGLANFSTQESFIILKDTRFTDIDDFHENSGIENVSFEIPLATPQTYQLTPTEVLTLLGANTIYADTGDTTVTYRADPTLYADKRSNATRSIIAGIEPTMTASKAYTTGQLLIVGDTLYKVAASIASGATLTPGTNVNPTTVAEQLILLANA